MKGAQIRLKLEAQSHTAPKGELMITANMERLHDSADVLHPVARVKILNPKCQSKQVNVPLLIDTGYSGALMLDANLVSELALEPTLYDDGTPKTRPGKTATGNSEEAEVFSGGVKWNDCYYELEVEKLDKPLGDRVCGLVGMKLLQLAKMTMDARAQVLKLE